MNHVNLKEVLQNNHEGIKNTKFNRSNSIDSKLHEEWEIDESEEEKNNGLRDKLEKLNMMKNEDKMDSSLEETSLINYLSHLYDPNIRSLGINQTPFTKYDNQKPLNSIKLLESFPEIYSFGQNANTNTKLVKHHMRVDSFCNQHLISNIQANSTCIFDENKGKDNTSHHDGDSHNHDISIGNFSHGFSFIGDFGIGSHHGVSCISHNNFHNDTGFSSHGFHILSDENGNDRRKNRNRISVNRNLLTEEKSTLSLNCQPMSQSNSQGQLGNMLNSRCTSSHPSILLPKKKELTGILKVGLRSRYSQSYVSIRFKKEKKFFKNIIQPSQCSDYSILSNNYIIPNDDSKANNNELIDNNI